MKDLYRKNQELEKERLKLEGERDKDIKYINHLDKQKKNETSNKEILDYVKELYEIALGLKKGDDEIKEIEPDKKKNQLKKKNDNNFIKELLENLKVI